MEERNNRVVKGMQDWLQREENISKLFSPGTLKTHYFQELKLDYLRELYNKFSKDASRGERMTLRILKGETKQLEQSLFPNRLVRMARSIIRFAKARFEKPAPAVTGERTNWMMKVAHKNVDRPVQENSQEKAIKSQQSQRKKAPHPQLVQKKRTAKKKGQGL